MWKRIQQLLWNSGIELTAFGLSVGVAVSMFPKTVFIDKMRNAEHYLENSGNERKVNKKIADIIQNVLSKFEMPPIEQNNVTFFMSSLSDPTFYGSVKTKFGALIGLPVTLEYNKPDRLLDENLSYGGIRLDLNNSSSEAATQLAESLLISDKAKAFVIARQLGYAASYNIHFELFLKTAAATGAILTMHYTRKHFSPILVKLTALPYFLLGLSILSGWGVLYIGLKDAKKCRLEYVVDKKVAMLGKEFAEGGVEYYESILQRNKSLRHLTKSGHKRFTPFGNEATTFRQNGLQVTSRKDNLVRLLAAYDKQDVTIPVQN